MSSVGRFLRLSTAEKWLFFHGLFWLMASGLALRLFGYRRWFDFLSRRSPSPPAPKESAGQRETAASVARLVVAAARRLPLPRNCLRESLVLWWLLRRQGIGAEICFGGRRVQQHFEAHAWVEHEGQVLNDSADVAQRFHPFQPADLPAKAKFQ